jgi:hypothetical protein
MHGQKWSALAVSACLGLVAAAAGAAQRYDFGNPSPEEEQMRQLINRARQDGEAEADRLGLVNEHPDATPAGDYDVGEGMTDDDFADQKDYWSLYQGWRQPVAWNAALSAAARNHCDDMHSYGWGHQTIDSNHGYSPGDYAGDRAFHEGYPNHFVFENILGAAPYSYQGVAWSHSKFFVDEPVLQRGHRKNILHSFHREIGVGFRQYGAPGAHPSLTHFWAIEFANDSFTAQGHPEDSAPDTVFATGLAWDDLSGDGEFQPGEEMPDVQVIAYDGSGEMLSHFAVTADGGGYSLPMLDSLGADLPAGEAVEVVFMDVAGLRRRTASGGIQSGQVVFEDDGPNPFSPTQRLNLGIDAEAADFTPVLAADANWDGERNLLDLAILADNWGRSNATWPEGDFTGDLQVNLLDLATLADNFDSGGGQPVPEPAALVLLTAGAIPLARRRPRPRD